MGYNTSFIQYMTGKRFKHTAFVKKKDISKYLEILERQSKSHGEICVDDDWEQKCS